MTFGKTCKASELYRARGPLRGIRAMIEEDRYCPEILKQTFGVRPAIGKMQAKIPVGRLHHCAVNRVRDGREEQVISELLELYESANP